MFYWYFHKFLPQVLSFAIKIYVVLPHIKPLRNFYFSNMAASINQSIILFPHNITLHTSNNNNGPILQSLYFNLFLYFFIELYKYIDVQKVEQ